ncbi:MAG TPA: acyl-CoA dehydrogenase [Rhodanobacteraceae bacterium]|nr:acyl-CoA dehydrogenase [Rhodanobacteraceae bacterium]
MYAELDELREQPGIAGVLAGLAPFPLNAERLAPALNWLLDNGYGRLPIAGGGRALERWNMLSTVAAVDLSLLKLYEGHTDAMAILDAFGAVAANGSWGVWAAETPGKEVGFKPDGKGTGGRLFGTKAWCSGAGVLDNALVTARTPEGESVLVQVVLKQPGIMHDCDHWKAVGMAAVRAGEVMFDAAVGYRVGKAGGYLERPGFWHGSIGIAACWYGAACAIAMTLRHSKRIERDPHAQAHLGAIDARLFAARCALQSAAAVVDAASDDDARLLALRVRAIVESAATETLDRVGRALGAAPLCMDAAHAQRCADLITFLRQSHAESDLQMLGARCVHDDGCLMQEALP